MTNPAFRAAFICEGSSDEPLAELVAGLFLDCGVTVRVTVPDFDRLGDHVGHDVASKMRATRILMGATPDVLIIHRDSDGAGRDARVTEILDALNECALESAVVPVVPVRMTEAWLLLDEEAIRAVAGNPRGTISLGLPKPSEVERRADPKTILQLAILAASSDTGRRRDRLARRFPSARRQLIERIDPGGSIKTLESWQALVADVQRVAAELLSKDTP